MLIFPLVAIVLLHLAILGSAENTIRLQANTRKFVDENSSGVRRYQATLNLDEVMFDMTEMSMEMEDSMIFVKSRSERRGDGTMIWSGIHHATDAPPAFLTLSQNSRGHISGSMKTASTTYSLLTLANGDLIVTATDRSRYRYVPAGVDQFDKTEVPASFRRHFTFNYDSMLKVDVRSRTAGMTKEVSYGPSLDLLTSKNGSPSEPSGRDLQTIPVADVMILVTNEAMCQSVGLVAGCPLTEENAIPIIDYLVSITANEVNDGMQLSGANAGIELVSVLILPEAFNPLKPDIQSLRFIDGSCDIRDLRVEANADLVAVITGDNVVDGNSITLGIAELDGFASITGLIGLTNTFTFTHEVGDPNSQTGCTTNDIFQIGHSYGCYHDRRTCEELENPSHPYAHGYQVPPFHRTVMAYQCEFDSCPLELPFFSTPELAFDGLPIGDDDHNNVRQLNDAAFDVSRRSLTATCLFGAQPNPPPTPQPTPAPVASPTECDPSNPFCSIADIILQLIALIGLIFGS